ncbi:hypothetical protein [Leifsonia sp. Le1]|uniref:hypothetical protein n=1 Tax=Leifsonia sp. Le1 TaxID=3404918 RepID=UPI003EBF616D
MNDDRPLDDQHFDDQHPDDPRFDDRRSAAWRNAIVESARADLARGGHGRKHVWTVVGLVIAALVVSGSGVAYALSTTILSDRSAPATSSATATPTPEERDTPTVIPAPVTPTVSPDDPIDALGAWQACADVGVEHLKGDGPDPVLTPYDPADPPTRNDDGTYRAVVAFTPAVPTPGVGSIVTICTVGGTRGDPVILDWTTKDI